MPGQANVIHISPSRRHKQTPAFNVQVYTEHAQFACYQLPVIRRLANKRQAKQQFSLAGS